MNLQEYYANYISEIENINFPKGQKAHPQVAKHGKGWAHGVEHHPTKEGHSVQIAGGDEGTAYHHIDNKGKHVGHIQHNHDEDIPSKREIKKQMPHAPSHVHDAVHKHLKTHFSEDYSQSINYDLYSDYITNQMKNYIGESLVHGMSLGDSSIHLNKDRTNNDTDNRTHYVVKNKKGMHHFSVHNMMGAKAGARKEIASKARLDHDHPFVKAVHNSHTDDNGGPKTWRGVDARKP